MNGHAQELVNLMCKMIEATVNNNPMTKQNREAYLNISWQIIMKYVRENRNETTNS